MQEFIENSYASLVYAVLEHATENWQFEIDWMLDFEEWDETNPSSSIALTRILEMSDGTVVAVFSINWTWFLCQGEALKVLMIETAIHEVCHLAAELEKMEKGYTSEERNLEPHGEIWLKHMMRYGLKGESSHLERDWVKSDLPESTLELIKIAEQVFSEE